MKLFLLIFPLLLLCSCGQNDDIRSTIAELRFPDSEEEFNLRKFSNKDLDPTIQAAVRPYMVQLETALDKEFFCPGYAKATPAQKESCWTILVKAMAYYESGLNPRAVFKEPNGVYSVGLLMLSPGECNQALSMAALKNAKLNLNCGVGKMADLVLRDGFISGREPKRGAARYWSVLRDPYKFRQYNLGKKQPIAKITTQYLSASIR